MKGTSVNRPGFSRGLWEQAVLTREGGESPLRLQQVVKTHRRMLPQSAALEGEILEMLKKVTA